MAASVGRPRGEPLAHEASATGSAMWRGWKPAFDAHAFAACAGDWRTACLVAGARACQPARARRRRGLKSRKVAPRKASWAAILRNEKRLAHAAVVDLHCMFKPAIASGRFKVCRLFLGQVLRVHPCERESLSGGSNRVVGGLLVGDLLLCGDSRKVGVG